MRTAAPCSRPRLLMARSTGLGRPPSGDWCSRSNSRTRTRGRASASFQASRRRSTPCPIQRAACSCSPVGEARRAVACPDDPGRRRARVEHQFRRSRNRWLLPEPAQRSSRSWLARVPQIKLPECIAPTVERLLRRCGQPRSDQAVRLSRTRRGRNGMRTASRVRSDGPENSDWSRDSDSITSNGANGKS